ncbi:MAG: HAMP domain-containing histidine kinase [Synergistaceae bacterium]|jgi:signal transduction histidine kinase|nr:HAMP domain-containing histidine kinase [Synergistaceae bacterium]
MRRDSQMMETMMPLQERGALKCILAGFSVLLLGLAVLYYGNLYVTYIIARLSNRDFGPMLFGTTFSVLVHGVQVLLLLLAWDLIGKGAGSYFGRAEVFVSITFSVVGIWLSWVVFPLIHPFFSYTFPLRIYIVLLLLALLELLTLQVENWVDKGAAMLLWVYSFQSLELLPVFPTKSKALSSLFEGMYHTSEEVAIASMAGMALFLSFMAGAMTSTWLLARYSIRLGQVRQLWQYAPRRKSEREEGLREVNMVDMRSLVHDLRNPLAAIKGMALLLHQGEGEEKEKAEVTLRAANYMERMINEILYEDRRNPVVVEKFFDSLEQHIRPFPWGEYVAVTVSPDARQATLSLNEIRFMRAILNVLDNAWRANRMTGARDIDLFVRLNARFVEIEILDHGPGYTPLSQKSGWGSTGLGLAFTRKVVIAHNGTLLLSQRTDGTNGASVLITIPLEKTA